MTIEEIKARSLRKLKAIPKQEFFECFTDWKECWHKYIVLDGDYFEGAINPLLIISTLDVS